MWRHLASNGLTLVIVALIAVAGVIGWANQQFRNTGPLQQAVFFEVKRGESLSSVSKRLEESGAISSGLIFRMGADYTERANALKFGNYEIPAGATMNEILNILTKGGQSTFRYVANYVIRNNATGELRLIERNPATGTTEVVARFAGSEPVDALYAELVAERTPMALRVIVPEGLTSWQVVEALKGADFLSGEVATLPAEGTLAPDSYEVTRGTERSVLIAAMQNAQAEILAAAWEARAEGLPVKTPE